MQPVIREKLVSVCGRLRQQRLFDALSQGLRAAALAGLACGLGRWMSGSTVPVVVGLTALAVIPLLAMSLAWLRKHNWRDAARRVDEHYGLQDRTLTALTLTGQGPLHEILLRDAQSQVQRLDAARVVPFRLPRGVVRHCLGVVVALGLLVAPFPVGKQPVTAKPANARQNGDVTGNSKPPPAVSSETAAAIRLVSRVGQRDEGRAETPLDQREIVRRYFQSTGAP